jgi:hypothetical protein
MDQGESARVRFALRSLAQDDLPGGFRGQWMRCHRDSRILVITWSRP